MLKYNGIAGIVNCTEAVENSKRIWRSIVVYGRNRL